MGDLGLIRVPGHSPEFFADAPDDGTIERIDWLEHMLRRPPYDKPTPSFWRRHRHDRLVERWARAVGRERVTVVVVDDRDREGLMRTFEVLLGVPAGLLRPGPDAANRSLTLAETEMLRNLNKEFRANLPAELYSQLARNGAVTHMKNTCTPGPGDVKIGTPRWAVEAAAEAGAEIAERIGRTGIGVIGDMRLLSEMQKPCGTPRPPSHARFTRRRPRNWCEYSAIAASSGCGFGEPVPLLTAIP
ncbi:hypothetical protein [Streptomyces bicolor]|uniref:hypothetical protein n=1 Tax=Streptomyces bicolor TaxID=66874 RepID=UPI000689957D|nr:hypothetical protein [Streptomyces bicolor]